MTIRRARLGRGWEARVAMLKCVINFTARRARAVNLGCVLRAFQSKTMITQLIEHERIETTLPRAKELSKLADKCVTLAKEATPVSRERAGAIVRTETDLHKLFTLLAQRYRDRDGGYTRVIKSRKRMGDAAPMAFIEFVDRPGEMRTPRPPAARRAPSLLPLAAQVALDSA